MHYSNDNFMFARSKKKVSLLSESPAPKKLQYLTHCLEKVIRYNRKNLIFSPPFKNWRCQLCSLGQIIIRLVQASPPLLYVESCKGLRSGM